MRQIDVHLKSISPYSQSRPLQSVIDKSKETDREFEARVWRERLHSLNGNVFIPPGVFKNCLNDAAMYLQLQIPGKGKRTYTKHIQAGINVVEGIKLPIKVGDVAPNWLFVPSDGKPGGSKRVWKCFPLIQSWEGTVTFHVLDDMVTLDVLRQHLEVCGNFIGIGSYRPRNRGYFGRFQVVKLTEKQ